MSASAWLNRGWRAGLVIAYGLMRLYWFAFRPRTRGVYVAVWCGDRILLIRNSYRLLVSVPGGRVHRGEALAEAAARELREEVGIALGADQLERVAEYTVFEHHHEDRASFFEFHCDGEPSVRVDQREVVWAGFRSREQALAERLVAPVRTYLTQRVR